MQKVLIRSTHGAGDLVQLTIILQHLKKYQPNWELYLQCLIGKHPAGYGYCKRVWHDKEPQPNKGEFDRVYNLAWNECYNTYSDSPSTKACQCLREVFNLQPDRTLLKYKLHVSDEARAITRGYLDSIGATGRAVAIHYEGNTSGHKKNVNREVIGVFCDWLIGKGLVPVILDWDRRSCLPNQKTIFNPGVGVNDIWGNTGTGDVERITALVEACKLFVGIDSCPQKCAGATNTPSIGLWVGHSPIQFMDLSPNFIHLVPHNFPSIPPMHDSKAMKYFYENYRYQVYRDLTETLIATAKPILHPSRKVNGFHVTNPPLDYIMIEDVYLNDAYRICLIPKQDRGEIVVDCGAHIGTFSRLYHERNPKARIFSIEASPNNLEALKANVGEYSTVIHAAATYDTQELFLLNASNTNTGGSRVVNKTELDACQDAQYWKDTRALERINLHELMEREGLNHIDLLKLDIEGCEFNILENAPLDRIKFIVGEAHDPPRFRDLLKRKFHTGWSVGWMSANGACEVFHLRNDAFIAREGK